MNVINLLTRMVKLSLMRLTKLSSLAKITLIAGLAFLLKHYLAISPKALEGTLRRYQMSITDFLNPMNTSLLEWIKVSPEIILAKDKLNNLISVNRMGMPTAILYKELK